MANRFEALRAIEREGEEGRTRLCAPHVGRFVASVVEGQLVEAGQPVGTLQILNRRHDVLAPAGTSGRVVRAPRQRVRALGWGEVLFELAPASAGAQPALAPRAGDHALEEGEFVFEAPTDGLFYAAPSPDDPPFVAVGDLVTPGQKVGLIEVMKFFYPIAYEGSEPGRLVRIVPEDATPVEAGAALLVLTKP